MNFIGFDIVQKYVKDAIERVMEEEAEVVHHRSGGDNNHTVTLDLFGIQEAAAVSNQRWR